MRNKKEFRTGTHDGKLLLNKNAQKSKSELKRINIQKGKPMSKECIHGVPLDWNCNACSDECHPKRIMPEESYTLQQAVKIILDNFDIVYFGQAGESYTPPIDEVMEILND